MEGDGQPEAGVEKAANNGSASSLEESKRPFEMPEDDGDTFRDIGVALGKSVVLLFVLTACAASAFQAIETPKELSRAMHARVTLAGMRAKYNITKSDYADMVDALSVPTPRCGRCNRADLDSKCTSKLKHCNWNWIGSFYFAFTIFTTIGYGTFTPATAGGKVLVVIIFFPGVIALGYFMAGIARLNKKVHHDLASIGQKARGVPPSLFLPLTPSSAGDTKAFQGCMCMFVFALPFLFVLAYGYHASEEMGWTLGNGCYYAFVTLSTIGFGDYSIRDVTLWEVLFILIGVGIIAMAIGVTTDLIESNMAAAKEAAARAASKVKLAASDAATAAERAAGEVVAHGAADVAGGVVHGAAGAAHVAGGVVHGAAGAAAHAASGAAHASDAVLHRRPSAAPSDVALDIAAPP